MPADSKGSSSSGMTSELVNMGVLSAGNFGKAGPFLAALEQQLYQSIVPRRSSRGSSIAVDEAIGTARQKQTASPDGDEAGERSVFRNYFHIPYEANGIVHHRSKAEEGGARQATSPEAAQRLAAVAEGFWFLRDFIEARWPVQLLAGYIKIQCDLTLDEVKGLGCLSKAEGSRRCRKLVSAPVIHDEIGYALWSELARESAAGRGEAPGEETQVIIKATPVSAGLTTKAMTSPTATSKPAGDEVTARRARSMRRRATDGETATAQPRPRAASTHAATTARRRRKSDMQLVRPHQVICTTCGSRAVPHPRNDDDDDDDDDDEDDGGEDGPGRRERKRDTISRRLSVKMNKTLARFGENLAAGYGGNGVSRVTG
ncbi:hypothetical protein LX36DRAFT_713426 [Colletotrichum falcatum]|nr:hypothetical protein LX36DRAFT_713426 [Colletotrichum falcatum]